MTDVGADPACCATCARVAEEQSSPERDAAKHWWLSATAARFEADKLRAELAKDRDQSGQRDKEITMLRTELAAVQDHMFRTRQDVIDELVATRKALAEKTHDNDTLRAELAFRQDSAIGKLAATPADAAQQCTQDKIEAAYLAADQAGQARDQALDETAAAWRLLSALIDEWSDATGFDVCFDCWSPHGEDTGTYDDDSFLCRSCQLERMKAGSG